ncbi:hypothetical protein ACJX0J_033912 [Zea mays]
MQIHDLSKYLKEAMEINQINMKQFKMDIQLNSTFFWLGIYKCLCLTALHDDVAIYFTITILPAIFKKVHDININLMWKRALHSPSLLETIGMLLYMFYSFLLTWYKQMNKNPMDNLKHALDVTSFLIAYLIQHECA